MKKKGLMDYLLKYKLSIAVYIISTLFENLSVVFIAILSAKAIEFVTITNYEHAINNFLLVLILILIRWGCRYLSNWIYFSTGGKIVSDLNSDLSKQSFKLSSKTYSDNSSGVFVERIINDPRELVSNLSELLYDATEILSSLVIITYVATLNYIICIILVTIIGICVAIDMWRQKVYEKNEIEVSEVEDEITSLATEIIKSERDIKSLGLEKSLSVIAKRKYEKNRKYNYKRDMTENKFWRAINLTAEIGYILMLILSIIFMEKSLITIVVFMIVYAYQDNIYRISTELGELSNILISIKIKCRRMFSLFNDDLFESEKFGYVQVDNIVGDIEFKNVSFSYKDYKIEKDKKTKNEIKALETETPVFKSLNLKIPHNKTVAFVGKSGSGKSTILGLLSKIYNVDSGEVLIDNYNIQSLNKESLRKTFSLVNQFPYIFDMSIKENLLMANKDASEEELQEVINQSYLDEFVFSLKEGINTRVGENGVKLSGGQKQRFAIARALLRKTPIILFDESTSSLDNIAQKEIKKSIDGLKGKSTIVIVAHRLSTIKDVDIIFFLDEGKIIDQGSFDELYDNNEKFKEMFLAENI